MPSRRRVPSGGSASGARRRSMARRCASPTSRAWRVTPATSAPAPAVARGNRRRADVEVVQDGSVVATVTARLEVVASGPVVLVRHAIARGTVLTRADVTLEERELGAASGGVLTTLADAIGKE